MSDESDKAAYDKRIRDKTAQRLASNREKNYKTATVQNIPPIVEPEIIEKIKPIQPRTKKISTPINKPVQNVQKPIIMTTHNPTPNPVITTPSVEDSVSSEDAPPENKGPSKFSKYAKAGWGATKWAGGAAASGAKFGWGATKAVGGVAANGASMVGEQILGGGKGGNASTGLVMLFILSILFHFYDAATGFNRATNGKMLAIMYLALIVIAFVFVYKGRINSSEEGMLIGVILVAYFLPFVKLVFTDNSWVTTLAGLLFLLPVLTIYLGLKFPEGKINWLFNAYIVIWVLILIAYLIMSFAPAQVASSTKMDPMSGVRFVTAGIGKTLKETTSEFQNSLRRSIAKATGEPYEGQEESQVGLYVEDVKPLESKYTTASDVFVEARIKAVNVKEPITVNTICYIDNVRQGTTKPAQLRQVRDNYDNIITCELGKLPKGSYNVKVLAFFAFETTSDIEYTFVNSQIRSDQYDELGIDPQAIATYTGGPVELGLPSLTQPLRVDTSRSNEIIANYPFGVSLKSKWTQGKIIRGLTYTLNTPQEVKLVDCNRNPVSKNESDSVLKRNTYSFKIDESNAQDVFDAVQCRMSFTEVGSLLGSGLKSTKTFAAQAVYEYGIEATAYVTVEE